MSDCDGILSVLDGQATSDKRQRHAKKNRPPAIWHRQMQMCRLVGANQQSILQEGRTTTHISAHLPIPSGAHVSAVMLFYV